MARRAGKCRLAVSTEEACCFYSTPAGMASTRWAWHDGLHPPLGGEPAMQTLLQDLRYSVRQLIKSPGFTLTAVISLALGIGATTAVFSVIYAALIDPYPFPAADRIVRMSVSDQDRAPRIRSI